MKMPSALSASIDKVARTAMGKDWGLYASLLERWSEIVGPDYAQETAPVKISFPRGKKSDEKWTQGRRNGGTLTISLPQGMSFAFSHQSEQVRSRINSFFGYDAIEKITLQPFYPRQDRAYTPPLPALSAQEKDALQKETKDIENNELREALATLGASVLANQKRL
ncbi:MAG: DUF721 domain-containing protein [Bdellovibrionales bacterium]